MKNKKITKHIEPERIVFFSTFEEENEYTARQRAGKSFDERMTQMNTWPPISNTFKIMPPYTNETSQ